VSRQAANSSRREGGTASIELIAVVPFLLLAVLVAAQLALVGQALWSAGVAARAGARAALVGGDPKVAARRALPPALREDAEVIDTDAVAVRVRIPRLLTPLPRLSVSAEAGLGRGDG
jgi:hypothetical protein